MTEPVLVASADGVGTKLAVARMMGDYSTVGRDLVNHCVNDILVQGAEPLFFLDYVGAGVLEPEKMVELVEGVAEGCRENGCALLGGETAEMPGFYQPGDYELVGFIVGMVDRPQVLDGSRVAAGRRARGPPLLGAPHQRLLARPPHPLRQARARRRRPRALARSKKTVGEVAPRAAPLLSEAAPPAPRPPGAPRHGAHHRRRHHRQPAAHPAARTPTP